MPFTFSPPNQLTLLRILLTPIFVAFLLAADPVLRQLSLVVFIVAVLTDWYDGWVARRWGYISPWGRFLDPLADKVLTSAALLAFVYLGLVPAWTVWVIVVRDILITLLRSYSELRGKPFDATKFAKTKTVLQFIGIYYVLILYVAQHVPSLEERYSATIDALLDSTLLYVLMVMIAGITLWTGLVYLIDNKKTIRELFSLAFRVSEPE
jgi:CDP-diacylglycerol--glycerol-3-phosphate 3-phosphatidyltransferase